MRVSFIDPVTGAKVDPGDSATQGLKIGPAGVPTPTPPAVTPGTAIPLQTDMSGSLLTADTELKRDRSALEEMRLIAEATENFSLRGRSGEQRIPFVDRRGGSGQRGTLR